jgi:hypothetical protein
MPIPSIQDAELQLVMAFGQGSGAMIAAPEALRQGLQSQRVLLQQALPHWHTVRFTLYELVRLAGQIAATSAVMHGLPEIDLDHVSNALERVLAICPCQDLIDLKGSN